MHITDSRLSCIDYVCACTVPQRKLIVLFCNYTHLHSSRKLNSSGVGALTPPSQSLAPLRFEQGLD